MKTKQDLLGKFLICYNEEDWYKTVLILSVYTKTPLCDFFPTLNWDSLNKYQYVYIKLDGTLGYGDSRHIDLKFVTENLTEICLKDFFVEY